MSKQHTPAAVLKPDFKGGTEKPQEEDKPKPPFRRIDTAPGKYRVFQTEADWDAYFNSPNPLAQGRPVKNGFA